MATQHDLDLAESWWHGLWVGVWVGMSLTFGAVVLLTLWSFR